MVSAVLFLSFRCQTRDNALKTAGLSRGLLYQVWKMSGRRALPCLQFPWRFTVMKINTWSIRYNKHTPTEEILFYQTPRMEKAGNMSFILQPPN